MVHIIARLSENFTYDMMQSVRAEQQVQSKMTEMINSAISETAENAKIMVETATDSAKMMENSMESIQSIRESATQIGKTNSHMAETMEELQKKSKEVHSSRNQMEAERAKQLLSEVGELVEEFEKYKTQAE